MQYSQEHLKTMVYAEFGGQTECIMGNWKIENTKLYKGAGNVSANNSETLGHKDQRFGKIVYILVFYNL